MGNVVAIIPARSGSKGVVDKNIKLLAGYPLIAYSISAARLAKSIDRIIVSTDSEEYADIAQKYGAEVPFLRPAKISGDKSMDYDFFKHLIEWFRQSEGEVPEYLVHLRPTSPLRNPVHVDLAINAIMNDASATALRSVHEMTETTYKTFEIENGFLKCVCSGSLDIETTGKPRQDYPKTYDGNGYVDVVKSSYILEKRRIHGDHVIAHITPRIHEVDTIEDFNYLKYQVSSDPTLVKSLFD